jgi:dephospho-CoA kinase
VAPRLLRVALTGGIATGKSYCRAGFARLGVPTIDADALARNSLGAGSDALGAVVRRFGQGVLRADGSLNRDALARMIFARDEARRDLEAIVHPLVYAQIRVWFNGFDAGTEQVPVRFALAEIPLVYETGHAAEFDRVIVAACDRAVQKRRVMARDHLSDTEAEQRLTAQMPIDEKRRRADYVIDTGRTLGETDTAVFEIWQRLRMTALVKS